MNSLMLQSQLQQALHQWRPDVPPEGQGALYENVRKIIQNVAHLRQIVDGAKRGDFDLPVEMFYTATLLKVPKGCCAACPYPVACCLVTEFCDLGRLAYCLLSWTSSLLPVVC